MVSPPVNPHPFVSDVFEQAGVAHLSSAGGTPTLFYPASTSLPAEGEDGGTPTPILSGGAGSPLGAAPLFADEGGRKMRKTRPLRTGRLTPWLGGASLSNDTTKVTVVAAVASDGLPPTAGGDISLSAATEVVAVVDAEDTAAELITCVVPLWVMAPAPTSPEEDTSRSSGIPAKGVTAAATAEGVAAAIGVETELVTSVAPRRMVAPAPTVGDSPRGPL
jgi:hypothetical protein